MRRWTLPILVIPSLLAAVSCGPNNNAVGNTGADVRGALPGGANRTQYGTVNNIGAGNPRMRASDAGIAGDVPGTPPRGPQHGNVRLEQAIANHVASVPNVRHAWVFVAGNTAYVAVQLRQGVHTGIAQVTKEQITRIVKAGHPNIRTVYVSASPDAYQRFQTFANEFAQGRPVQGIWSNFQAFVQRIWPTAR